MFWKAIAKSWLTVSVSQLLTIRPNLMITESDCKKLKSCFNTPQHKALGNQFALHMECFGVWRFCCAVWWFSHALQRTKVPPWKDKYEPAGWWVSCRKKNVENYRARWNTSNIIILNEPWKDFSWFSTDSVNGTRKCYSNQVSRKVIINIYRMNTITTHTQQTELHSSSPHSVCLQVFWSSSRSDHLVQRFAWSLNAAKY